MLGVEHQGDPATALRHLLVATIEALEPDEHVPAHTSLAAPIISSTNGMWNSSHKRRWPTTLASACGSYAAGKRKALELLAARLVSHYRLDEDDNSPYCA